MKSIIHEYYEPNEIAGVCNHKLKIFGMMPHPERNNYDFKHILLKFKGRYYFNDFEICVLSGILIYLWPIIPTGNVFNNWINIMASYYSM